MNFEYLYIDGEWVSSASGEVIEVEDPATREIFGTVPAGNWIDVDLAVKAAKKAFSSWRKESLSHRIKVMHRALEVLKENRYELVAIEVRELGAPLRWAERAHVNGPIARFESYLHLMEKVPFEVQLNHSKVLREPVGVIGCLTPWNYPLGQVMQKIVPAILCGNTVVLKPSQLAPLSAMILAEAFHEAGLPPGVFNLVTGRGAEVGNALAVHPEVDMISFTGSTKGGAEVGKLAMETIKKVALELGGKSANIILEGADLTKAVKFGLSSCFDNTGQTCAALTRMLVPRGRVSEVEAEILAQLPKYRVGMPSLETSRIGPLISLKQYEKVRFYVQKGLEEGAVLLTGEVPPEIENNPKKGYFVKPCVFTNVSNHMRIAREEIFGPVMCLIPYDSVEEAIAIANDSPYGLSGAVYGPAKEALEVAKALRTGTVYINESKRDIEAPFGGYKQSGIGREGGLFGIEEFLEIKAVFDEPLNLTEL